MGHALVKTLQWVTNMHAARCEVTAFGVILQKFTNMFAAEHGNHGRLALHRDLKMSAIYAAPCMSGRTSLNAQGSNDQVTSGAAQYFCYRKRANVSVPARLLHMTVPARMLQMETRCFAIKVAQKGSIRTNQQGSSPLVCIHDGDWV